jgi:transposase
MSISTPKQATRSPALTAAGSKLVAIRDALSAGASFRSALLAERLHYYTVNRWIQCENPPDHAELLAEIREIRAIRAIRKFVPKEQRETQKKAERRREVEAAQAARVAEMNQGDEIPVDALTYREAADRVDRHRDTIQGWVTAKKLRAFYRLNDRLGVESLVSLASVQHVAREQKRGWTVHHKRAVLRHESKIPRLVDLLRSGVPKKHACAELGITQSTLNAWIENPGALGPAASALLVDLHGSALNEKRQLVTGRMEIVLEAVRAGKSLRELSAQMGGSRLYVTTWLEGVSGCEDLCARFRDEYAAAKKQGRDVRAKEKEGQAEVTSKPRSKAAWVYFIQDFDGRGNIKIGFTARTVEKRLAELSTGSPVRLVVLRKVRAPRSFETWLHERFAGDRQCGEWFSPSPRLLALIDQVQDHPDMGHSEDLFFNATSQEALLPRERGMTRGKTVRTGKG